MRRDTRHWGMGFLVACALMAGCSQEPSGPSTAGGQTKGGEADGAVLALTDATFATQIATGVVLVDFWAPWCGPCRTQGPIVAQVAKQLGATAKVAKINVDHASKTAQQFGVQSIPTLIVFKDGKPGKRFVGVTQADALVAAVRDML